MADSPPLTPDSPTARRWLSEELAKPEYQDNPSLIERLMKWLSEHFGGGVGVGGVSIPAWLIAVVLLAVLVTLFVVSWRRHRPSARVEKDARRKRSATVFDAARLEAGDYLARARELRGRDDAAALLAAYRALVVRAEDGGMLLLDDATTVGDVTHVLRDALRRRDVQEPSFGVPEASHAFESVRYGHHTPTTAQVDGVLALEALVREAPSPSGAAR